MKHPGRDGSAPIGRRSFLELVLLGVASTAMSACGASTTRERRSPERARDETRPRGPQRVLLAYFSRPGENYWYGGRRDLRVGNTEVLAHLIAQRLRCDVHRIEAAELYSDDYDDTVARNVREQDEDARPRIAEPLPAVDPHDVVILASPLWNVRPPMIMRTFAERYDFADKLVLPVTTYAVSGLGSAADEYADACRGATIGRGLAVRGEEVRDAGGSVDAWLRRTHLQPN
jgi:flavodoxin